MNFLSKTVAACVFSFFIAASASAQVCKESNGNLAGKANMDCDMRYRDQVVACDKKNPNNSKEVVGTRPSCPSKPMPMIDTPSGSYIGDYSPYLFQYPRDAEDPSKPYSGAFALGTAGDASRTFQLFGNTAPGTKRLAACTTQIKLPSDPKTTGEWAQLVRLQIDNCANQYILNAAIYPVQKESTQILSLDDPKVPGKKIGLESECQPLKTYSGEKNEYEANTYLEAAWKKLLQDPTYRKTTGAMKGVPCIKGGLSKLNLPCDHEPHLPVGMTLENPLKPPSPFPEVRLSNIASVPYEEINDPTHPFSPRWDFLLNDRDYSNLSLASIGSPGIAVAIQAAIRVYMKEPKNAVFCAGVKNADNESDAKKKSDAEVKVDVLEFRRKMFEDSLKKRTGFNLICKLHKNPFVSGNDPLVIVAPASFCYKITRVSPFPPFVYAKGKDCWDCFGLGGGGIAGGLGSLGGLPGGLGGIAGSLGVPSNLVGSVTGAVTGNLTGAVTGAVTGALPGGVGNVIGGVTGGLPGGVGNVIGGVTGGLPGGVGNVIGGVTGGLPGGVGNVIGGVTGGLPGGVGNVIGGVTGGLPGGVGNVVGGVTGGLPGGVGNVVGTVAGGLPGGVGNVVGTVAGGLPGGVGNVVGTVAGGLPGGVGNVIGGVTGGLPGGVGNVVGTVTGGLPGGVGNVVGTVAGGLPGGVGSALTGALPAGVLPGGLGGPAGPVTSTGEAPCSTNYIVKDLRIKGALPGGLNAFKREANCGTKFDKICKDLRAPYTSLNKLKMRYHNPDDKDDKDGNNVVLKGGALEGMTFSEHFGNHMPYPKIWDLGQSLQMAPTSDKNNQPPLDTTGQYTAIVGVGREAAAKVAADAAPADADGKKADEKFYDQRCKTQGWGDTINPLGISVGGVTISTPDPITSWTETKLYQTRTLRSTGLSCLGRYEKVFKPGSAENMMLLAAGAEWERAIISKCPRLQNGRVGDCKYMTIKEFTDAGNPEGDNATVYMKQLDNQGLPLTWRGYMSAEKTETKFPAFGGAATTHATGLDNAELGDIILLPKGPKDDGGLAKLALVISTGDRQKCASEKNCYVQVLEPDNGKWPDVCGTTDTWGEMKVRHYFKPGHLPQETEAELTRIHSTKDCEETKLSHCEMSAWDKLKIYRPVKDVRKGCKNKDRAAECEKDE